MAPVMPTLTPKTFLALKCTSPNMTMPRPVVARSFIWPARKVSSVPDVTDYCTPWQWSIHGCRSSIGGAVPVTVVVSGEFTKVHLKQKRPVHATSVMFGSVINEGPI